MLCRYAKEKGLDDGLEFIMCGTESEGTKALWGPGLRDVYILHYVLTGKGFFNGQPVNEGQGFFIRANDIVHYRYDDDEPWQYFWIMFNGKDAEKICRKFVEADENGIFSFSFAKKICDMMPELFSTDDFMTQSEGLALFYYLMSLHEQKKREIDESSENHYVVSAKNSIYLSLHQPISISKIALKLGISDRYLYNLFIKYEGIAPKKYINMIRIKNAKALLENSDYTITEIGSSVGFSDVMTFSAFFSKHVGTSPSEYRKSKSLHDG